MCLCHLNKEFKIGKGETKLIFVCSEIQMKLQEQLKNYSITIREMQNLTLQAYFQLLIWNTLIFFNNKMLLTFKKNTQQFYTMTHKLNIMSLNWV